MQDLKGQIAAAEEAQSPHAANATPLVAPASAKRTVPLPEVPSEHWAN